MFHAIFGLQDGFDLNFKSNNVSSNTVVIKIWSESLYSMDSFAKDKSEKKTDQFFSTLRN